MNDPSTSHPFVRPGQVRPDLPAADACMACAQPEADHAVRPDSGGWISGPALPGPESPADLLDRLRAAHPAWTINAPHPLGLWSAEWRSDDHRAIHYIVCRTAVELAARLEAVDPEVQE
jgi:hypothetical protein